jgi:lipopolysaccharide export system permease protein
MLIIHKYLARAIISTILLVILLLLGLEAFIAFTREFPDVGTGYYGLPQVFAYVPMILPLQVYRLFPMAGLLGSMMGLGVLASHSELIVMRTFGLSIANIAKVTIKIAAVLVLFMFIFGEFFAPLLQYKADVYKNDAMGEGQTLVTQRGVWVRSGDNFLHIDKVLSKGKIEGATRYAFTGDNKLALTSFAKSGEYVNGAWVFHDVAQTNFQDNTVTTEQFATQQWGMTLTPKLLGITAIDPDQKSLPQLYMYIKFLKQGGLNYSNYAFIFWQRIFQPLATLVMIILAVPFVFGPLRSVTMGLRMVIGIVLGFCFYILNQFVGPISIVYQIPPVIAAFSPTFLFALIGVFLVRRRQMV